MGALPSGAGMKAVLGIGAVIAVPMWLSQGHEAHAVAGPPAAVSSYSGPVGPRLTLDPNPVGTAQRAADAQRDMRNYWVGQKVLLNAKPPKVAATAAPKQVAAPKPPKAAKQAKQSQPKAQKPAKQAAAPKQAKQQSTPSSTTTGTAAAHTTTITPSEGLTR
jgi:outer membrane biosynthesis protein TonB